MVGEPVAHVHGYPPKGHGAVWYGFELPDHQGKQGSFAGAHRRHDPEPKGSYPMGTKLELDPDVDDEAPNEPHVTPYDEEHHVTYQRLVDAEAQGADWKEVALIVLHRDPSVEEARTRRCWESHLARAQWFVKGNYRKLLDDADARDRT